ncbi:Glyco_trans_2-like domain-containing protein [Methanocaldococcus lauensis]|uniref:Glyco_trans_2-like domain-containing protein n=1 Tax=Methanocaldococcus lauensis TaxID=2546128 RepID=A0A8D6PWW6_9EURY|nr:glycosyltransferase [Methanocaldococcus lauensis]CAB3290095.1 Glyco_trans_2-like domain-containing protein [Methanocaldococcus lauensis]
MYPEISIIMSAYNEPEKYLRESIESILNQTFKDFEFIIILDNPNNVKAERIIKEYQKKDKRIVFIKNEKNLGLAGSLNNGLDIAKGKYIARMDADDIALPERLEKQYKYMENNKNIDLLFSWVYFIDENGNILKEFKPSKEKIKNLSKYFFKEHLLVHPTLMAKSEILKKNKYDENQKRSQDFELWMRLITKGYKFDIIEEFLLKYRVLKENYRSRIKKQIEYSKYSLKALWKHKKYYWKNIYYWNNFLWHFSIFLSIKIVPKKILTILIKLKGR